jgi:hypothetical protein
LCNRTPQAGEMNLLIDQIGHTMSSHGTLDEGAVDHPA